MEKFSIPTLEGIKSLIEPLYQRLHHIESELQKLPKVVQPSKYYRTKEIKELFGISNNTIIKYREKGTLPYTMLGEVYLYEVNAIRVILEQNKVCA